MSCVNCNTGYQLHQKIRRLLQSEWVGDTVLSYNMVTKQFEVRWEAGLRYRTWYTGVRRCLTVWLTWLRIKLKMDWNSVGLWFDLPVNTERRYRSSRDRIPDTQWTGQGNPASIKKGGAWEKYAVVLRTQNSQINLCLIMPSHSSQSMGPRDEQSAANSLLHFRVNHTNSGDAYLRADIL